MDFEEVLIFNRSSRALVCVWREEKLDYIVSGTGGTTVTSLGSSGGGADVKKRMVIPADSYGAVGSEHLKSMTIEPLIDYASAGEG